MSKKNDWGGLILLGGLGLLGYLLWKGGVFGSGQGTTGGGGSFFDGMLPPLTPPVIPPQDNNIKGQELKVGILEKPVLNKVQPYAFVGEDKSGYVQKTVNLTTTPAMAIPSIVQSRGIIAQTIGIDVGKLVQSIPIARKTYSSTPKSTHVATTYSGTPVNTIAGLKEITNIIIQNRPSSTPLSTPLPIKTTTLPKTFSNIATATFKWLGVAR